MDPRSDEVRHQLSRRGLLGLGVGLAGAAVLSACSDGSSPSVPSGSKAALLPDPTTPKALPGQLVSTVANVPLAYTEYPAQPYQSVASPPGTGGDVTTMQINFGAPPPALSGNKWQQELNRQLNVNLKATFVTDADLAQKTQTFIASGDIPDIFYLNLPKVPAALTAILQGAFLDLSKYIGGSADKTYPNLGALPALSWKNSAIKGGIFGVPRPVPVVNSGVPLYRADWQRKLGIPMPTKADDVFALLSAFANNNPTGTGKKDSWAFGEISPWDQEFVLTMFGVPNNWRKNPDGSLTKDIETDEFEAALEFLNKLWKAGAFHPSAVSNTWNQAQDLWVGGSTAFFGGNMLASLTYLLGTPMKGVNDLVADIKPFVAPGHDSGAAKFYQGSGNFGMFAIPSKLAKDEKRVQELLRILDYFAAPFGSAEFTLINYGIKGHNFDYKNAIPTVSDDVALQSEMSGQYVPSPGEGSIYIPGPPNQSAVVQHYFEQVMPTSIADPTINSISKTRGAKGASLDQIIHDLFVDIVSGRKSLTELKGLRSQWKSQGGDTVRREFQDAA